MTEKEKAEYLIEKFRPFVSTWDGTNDCEIDEDEVLKDAIQLAQMCCQEIVEATQTFPSISIYWQTVGMHLVEKPWERNLSGF